MTKIVISTRIIITDWSVRNDTDTIKHFYLRGLLYSSLSASIEADMLKRRQFNHLRRPIKEAGRRGGWQRRGRRGRWREECGYEREVGEARLKIGTEKYIRRLEVSVHKA